jgi:hypothetical protein
MSTRLLAFTTRSKTTADLDARTTKIPTNRRLIELPFFRGHNDFETAEKSVLLKSLNMAKSEHDFATLPP